MITQKNEVYLVLVSEQTLTQIPINPVDAVDKLIQIKNVKPQKLADGTWEARITQPDQIALLNDLNSD